MSESWRILDNYDWQYNWDKYTAIRINTTTGTATYDPPTVEVRNGDAETGSWICIYSGGSNGQGWGSAMIAAKLAVLGSAFENESYADLIAWLENNVYTEPPTT